MQHITTTVEISREELEKALVFNERLLKKTEKRTKRLERHATEVRAKNKELEAQIKKQQKEYKELEINYAVLEEEKKRIQRIVDDIKSDIEHCPWCNRYFADAEKYRNHLPACKKRHATKPPKKSHDRQVYKGRATYSSDTHS